MNKFLLRMHALFVFIRVFAAKKWKCQDFVGILAGDSIDNVQQGVIGVVFRFLFVESHCLPSLYTRRIR